MTASSEDREGQVIVVSGLSGSGKSVALRALEDAGWFCIDNLPAVTMPDVLAAVRAGGQARIALGIDARNRGSLDALPATIADLRASGLQVRLVFLDASTEELTRRYAETRRPHPFAAEGLTLPECIALERRLLLPFAAAAQRIETTHLRANALRSTIKAFASAEPGRLTLFLCSFGFKHGAPPEADFMFDVRFLPNPFYDPALRPLDGRDAPVAEFLAADPRSAKVVDDMARLLEGWLPYFVEDERDVLTVAIGCTGGQHRSVYLVERLAERLSLAWPARIIHRNLAT
ncbi:MAG: RNase adapter RapZ [Pseudomonadota bacterium]|nr:RNase adapter RapZ [Pseudomonadota bacterium]